MKNQLKYISTAFKVEWLKTKGLGLLYIGMALAILSPLFKFILLFFVEEVRDYDGFPASVFSEDILYHYQAFGGFFLLLFIIIAASRITQSDHKNNGWTFIETQPLSKFSIYFGKFLNLVALATISIVFFYVSSMLFSLIGRLIYPSEDLYYTVEWGLLFHSFLRLWILSLCVISFQLMLSMVFSSFIWPMLIGFLSFAINIYGSLRAEHYDYLPYNVVNTGVSITDPNILNYFFNYTEYLSLFWALVFIIIGYVIYANKGFKHAFLIPTKKIGFTILGIVIVTGVYFLISQPIYSKKSKELTVIEGTVRSSMKTDKVTIFENELLQKIAEIPVIDGKFRWETKEDIPFGSYTVDINKRQREIYLAKGDNIFLDAKISQKKSDFTFKGTRKAESHYISNVGRLGSVIDYIITYKKHTDNPKKFYEIAEEEWNDRNDFLKNYKTKENIFLSNDFETYVKQISAIQMLNALYEYQKNTSFVDKEFAIPQKFQEELNKVIAEPIELLYTSKDYKEWKMNSLLPKEGTENPDSIILAKLKEMPKSIEKDRLLSFEMAKILKLTDEDSTRTKFFNEYSNEFQKEKYKNYVAQQLALIKAQQKGSPFPSFEVVDKNGKTVDILKEFKDKYIVIDWWATWCAPCREIKPSFEYQAKRHSRDNIVFISISIDDNKKAWELDIKSDKSKVKQFWLKDKSVLGKLDIKGIPRFMIVDPRGKMYNSDLARPGEANFTEAMYEIRRKSL